MVYSYRRLAEKPWAYFLKPPGVRLVPVAKLKTIRARPSGIEHAEQHMYEAAYEDGPKRKPITVQAEGDHWIVLDGNSTTAVARSQRWRFLPAVVVKGS